MAAPFRVIRPGVGRRRVSAKDEPVRAYFERLIKMIPADVVGLYIVGSGLIPADQRIALVIWTAVCLLAVVVVRVWGTADPDPEKRLPPQWPVVAISSVSFVIWIYSMGGVFAAYGLAVPFLGSLLVLCWTFFVPIFYQGSFE
jgi:hypothetical protein